jgi:AbrB family looped-hinge helix DNA binding protein
MNRFLRAKGSGGFSFPFGVNAPVDPSAGIFPVEIGGNMAGYSTTRLSSRGQVVIPEEIRENLHLKEGDQFVVIGKGDTVILRSIKPPSMVEFEEVLAEAHSSAKKAELKKSDVKAAIKRVRRQSREK